MTLLDDIQLSYTADNSVYDTYMDRNLLVNQKHQIENILTTQRSSETNVNGSTNDVFNLIDTLTQYIETLFNNQIKNDDLVVSILLLSIQYHNQAHDLLYRNYTGYNQLDTIIDTQAPPSVNQSWQAASKYFQLSIGLLKFLSEEIFSRYNCPENLFKIWNIVYNYNIVYSNFSMVILGLYKLKDSLFDNYSQLELNKQTASQSLNFKTLAKILIHIYNVLENSAVYMDKDIIDQTNMIDIFQKQYIYGLIELFLSLQSFEIDNKIGLSCSYIKDSILIFTKQPNTWKTGSSISNNNSNNINIFESYMYETKNLILKNQNKTQRLKSVLKEHYLNSKESLQKKKINVESKTVFEKSFKKISFSKQKNSTTNTKTNYKKPNGRKGFDDMLVIDSFQDFIAPLLYMLEYRYDHFNDTISMEPIVKDRLELERNWPLPMSTPLNYKKWVYKKDGAFQPVLVDSDLHTPITVKKGGTTGNTSTNYF